MPECDGHSTYEKPKNTDRGVIHWVIEPHCHSIDHIEIWGEKVQEITDLNELFGQRVYIRIFRKYNLPNRFINLFKEIEPSQVLENATIELIGHDGCIPILKIGDRKFYAYVIKKIVEWPGYHYPPFKKAPT